MINAKDIEIGDYVILINGRTPYRVVGYCPRGTYNDRIVVDTLNRKLQCNIHKINLIRKDNASYYGLQNLVLEDNLNGNNFSILSDVKSIFSKKSEKPTLNINSIVGELKYIFPNEIQISDVIVKKSPSSISYFQVEEIEEDEKENCPIIKLIGKAFNEKGYMGSQFHLKLNEKVLLVRRR